MDFGDILNEWDRRSAEPVYDKDAETAAGVSAPERRRRLLRKKPDAVIDLHGLTKDEAWTAMEDFFRHARDQNFDKLLIIHGKGNHSGGESVLRQTTREFIERCPFAGESGHEKVPAGGNGATWVLLKGTG
jgi:DNA-nicking Smr family endonuclease